MDQILGLALALAAPEAEPKGAAADGPGGSGAFSQIFAPPGQKDGALPAPVPVLAPPFVAHAVAQMPGPPLPPDEAKARPDPDAPVRPASDDADKSLPQDHLATDQLPVSPDQPAIARVAEVPAFVPAGATLHAALARNPTGPAGSATGPAVAPPGLPAPDAQGFGVPASQPVAMTRKDQPQADLSDPGVPDGSAVVATRRQPGDRGNPAPADRVGGDQVRSTPEATGRAAGRATDAVAAMFAAEDGSAPPPWVPAGRGSEQMGTQGMPGMGTATFPAASAAPAGNVPSSADPIAASRLAVAATGQVDRKDQLAADPWDKDGPAPVPQAPASQGPVQGQPIPQASATAGDGQRGAPPGATSQPQNPFASGSDLPTARGEAGAGSGDGLQGRAVPQDTDRPASRRIAHAQGEGAGSSRPAERPLAPGPDGAVDPAAQTGAALAASPVPPALEADGPRQPPPAAAAAAHLAQQLATAVRAYPGGVEVALHPVELGQMRIAMDQQAQDMIVTLSADRVETLDLMRRHVDVLAQEFRDLGLGNCTFRFAQDGERRQGQAAPETTPAPAGAADFTDANAGPVALAGRMPAPAAGGLDLRL